MSSLRKLAIVAFLLCLAPVVAQAQIAHQATSNGDAGTTQLVILHPASIAAGNGLIACIVNKYPAAPPTKPDGWDAVTNGQASGGSGASGIDSGDVIVTVWTRTADGTESGTNLTVEIPSGNSAFGTISRYTKTLATWSYAASNGTDTSVGTAWSVTAAADPGVTAGDILYTCSGSNGNVANFTTEAMTQTGITFGAETELREGNPGDGDDSTMVVSNHVVSSGTSSAAPVFTMTGSATSGSTPAGATVFLRIREAAAAASGCHRSLLGVGCN